MSEEENKNSSVYGNMSFNYSDNGNEPNFENAGTIQKKDLTTQGFWTKFKNFWLQEIDWNTPIVVELTPYQQKIEDEINEFLHQEITWEKVHDFLFQEISFGKKEK